MNLIGSLGLAVVKWRCPRIRAGCAHLPHDIPQHVLYDDSIKPIDHHGLDTDLNRVPKIKRVSEKIIDNIRKGHKVG